MKIKLPSQSLIREILSIIIISLLGCASIVFLVLYIDLFSVGILVRYSLLIKSIAVAIVLIFVILFIVFYRLNKLVLYKVFFLTVVIMTVGFIVLYILKTSGFLDKLDSIDDFRRYVASKGKYAGVLFIILQFLQVVVLPIPAFITVGAGVLLFGAFKGALLSSIGIICGSVVAFFVGRLFGYRVAKWLIGKDSLDKGLKAIRGKDKIFLTFMFLFPFFPDDVLCFVAGITTVSPRFFVLMIIVTRFISVFASSYSMSGKLIPFNTWWGIILWILFIGFTVVLCYVICKKGNFIEKMISKRKRVDKNK